MIDPKLQVVVSSWQLKHSKITGIAGLNVDGGIKVSAIDKTGNIILASSDKVISHSLTA